MSFKFENLNVWQRALELTIKIRKACKSFPGEERFQLSSQLIRAADSVCLNIAEGSTGQSKPEQIKFLGYSLRSGIEVAAALHIALKLNYLSPESFRELYNDYEVLVKMISSFIRRIRE